MRYQFRAILLHRTCSVERAGMALAIALNFRLLNAIGLGTIGAAVRLRSCDCALASRIGALSLTLSIHLFTSRRAEVRQKLMHDKGHIPLGRKVDKGQVRLRSVSKIPHRRR